jgi:hypothetical protein
VGEFFDLNLPRRLSVIASVHKPLTYQATKYRVDQFFARDQRSHTIQGQQK